jgi:hypothetical protein
MFDEGLAFFLYGLLNGGFVQFPLRSVPIALVMAEA